MWYNGLYNASECNLSVLMHPWWSVNALWVLWLGVIDVIFIKSTIWFYPIGANWVGVIQMQRVLKTTGRSSSQPAYVVISRTSQDEGLWGRWEEARGLQCSDWESGNTITPPAVGPIPPPSRPLTLHHHHSPYSSKPPPWQQSASPGVVCDLTTQPLLMRTHHNNELLNPLTLLLTTQHLTKRLARAVHSSQFGLQ